LKALNAQSVLSPVPDADDGFDELQDADSELLMLENMNAQLPSSITSNSLHFLANRKRRLDANAMEDSENEPPLALYKMPRNVKPKSSLTAKSTVRDDGSSESVTPTSLRIAGVNRMKPMDEFLNDGELSAKSARRLVRCHSEAVIRSVLSCAEEHPNLIGDFSRPFSLPVISGGKHQDLKSISPDTVSILSRTSSRVVSCDSVIPLIRTALIVYNNFLYPFVNFQVFVYCFFIL
jgi:hypothetical protein